MPLKSGCDYCDDGDKAGSGRAHCVCAAPCWNPDCPKVQGQTSGFGLRVPIPVERHPFDPDCCPLRAEIGCSPPEDAPLATTPKQASDLTYDIIVPRGPALMYVSDDHNAVFTVLDRVAEPALMPKRDRVLCRALLVHALERLDEVDESVPQP